MKKVSLSGSPRANVGKKDAAALRNEGKVPAVVYGGGEQTHFCLNDIDIEKIVYTPDVYQIELDIDGKKMNAVIQELQFHPVTDKIVHVDFLQLFDDKPVKIGIPVRLTGNSIGVRNGGKLRQNFRKLKVVGLPGDLPESIEVDISSLRIGMSKRVRDIEIPGVKILDPAGAVVAGVKTARGAVDLDEEEEGEEGAEAAAEEGAEATAE